LLLAEGLGRHRQAFLFYLSRQQQARIGSCGVGGLLRAIGFALTFVGVGIAKLQIERGKLRRRLIDLRNHLLVLFDHHVGELLALVLLAMLLRELGQGHFLLVGQQQPGGDLLIELIGACGLLVALVSLRGVLCLGSLTRSRRVLPRLSLLV